MRILLKRKRIKIPLFLIRLWDMDRISFQAPEMFPRNQAGCGPVGSDV